MNDQGGTADGPAGHAIMRLFWRQGYASTSMSELVDAVGASRATTYRVHGSKKTLVQRALNQYRTEVLGPVLERLRGADGVAAITEAMRMVRDRVIDPTLPPGCMMVRLSIEMQTMPGMQAESDSLGRQVRDAAEQFRAAFETAVRGAMERGQIPPDRDAQAASHSLMLVMTGLTMHADGVPNEPELDRLTAGAAGAAPV